MNARKRLTFTDLNTTIAFNADPWTAVEFSDSKLVLKYAAESPDEKEHQTIVLKK